MSCTPYQTVVNNDCDPVQVGIGEPSSFLRFSVPHFSLNKMYCRNVPEVCMCTEYRMEDFAIVRSPTLSRIKNRLQQLSGSNQFGLLFSLFFFLQTGKFLSFVYKTKFTTMYRERKKFTESPTLLLLSETSETESDFMFGD